MNDAMSTDRTCTQIQVSEEFSPRCCAGNAPSWQRRQSRHWLHSPRKTSGAESYPKAPHPSSTPSPCRPCCRCRRPGASQDIERHHLYRFRHNHRRKGSASNTRRTGVAAVARHHSFTVPARQLTLQRHCHTHTWHIHKKKKSTDEITKERYHKNDVTVLKNKRTHLCRSNTEALKHGN